MDGEVEGGGLVEGELIVDPAMLVRGVCLQILKTLCQV